MSTMYILYFYIFLCTDSLKSSYCFTGAPYLLELWKLGKHTGRVSSLFKKKKTKKKPKKRKEGEIQQLLSLGRELKEILMNHLHESKNLQHPQCALPSFWSCNAFLSPWLVSDLLKQNKSPRKKNALQCAVVLLFFFSFLCMRLFIPLPAWSQIKENSVGSLSKICVSVLGGCIYVPSIFAPPSSPLIFCSV